MPRVKKEKSIRGKCPNCCPDGGAIFHLVWDSETQATVKECMNCGHKRSYRTVKPTGKATKSQEKVLARIVATFGGAIEERRMIGRKLWFTAKNPEKHWISGNSIYGTIGVNGKVNIVLSRLGGDAKITDDIGISVYLRRS